MKWIRLDYLRERCRVLVVQYPVELVACIVAYAALMCSNLGYWNNNKALLLPLVFGASYGINNFARQGKLPRWAYYATLALLVVALVVQEMHFIYSPAYWFGLLLAAMFVVLSERGSTDNEVARNFVNVVQSLVSAVVVAVVLSVLFLLIYFSVKYIFSISYDSDRLLEYVLEFIWIVIAPSSYLIGIDSIRESQWSISKFGNILINYILGSAILIYTVILYLYLVQISFKLSLPLGGLSAMITAFYIVTFAWLLFHEMAPNKHFRWLYKYFGYISLPLLVLFWIGLTYRIREYGFTESRVYMMVAGVEMVIGSAVLIFGKRNRFSSILYAAAALIALSTYIPYISANDIGVRSQTERMIRLVRRVGAYNEKTGELRWLESIDEKYVGDYREMWSAYIYLCSESSDEEMEKRYGRINKYIARSDEDGRYNSEEYNCPERVDVGEYRYVVTEDYCAEFKEERLIVTIGDDEVLNQPAKMFKAKNGVMRPGADFFKYNNEEYMLVISKANVYSDGSIYTYEYTLMAKDKARKAKK